MLESRLDMPLGIARGADADLVRPRMKPINSVALAKPPAVA